MCGVCGLFQNFISLTHNDDKVVVFDRAEVMVFIFNFHPTKSFTDYKIGVNTPGSYPLDCKLQVY